MRYEIIYSGGQCHNYANGTIDLMVWLDVLKDETIADIRRVHESGQFESVLSQYKGYIAQIKKAGEKGGGKA